MHPVLAREPLLNAGERNAQLNASGSSRERHAIRVVGAGLAGVPLPSPGDAFQVRSARRAAVPPCIQLRDPLILYMKNIRYLFDLLFLDLFLEILIS